MLVRIMKQFVRQAQKHEHQRGQSIVLVALGFVGLLAIVGTAVDIGVVYARRAQLSTAVDAAALAGVVELNRDANEYQNALDRAAEFLHANRITAGAIENTLDNQLYAFDAERDSATLGARTFALTVTVPVELYFLRVIGQQSVQLTESATASNFPLADIYASRRVETGALSTSNQAVFGPGICVSYGDPFSPASNEAAQFRARWLGNANQRAYRYRILIPDDYESQQCSGGDGTNSLCDVVRVEIFDADSYNSDSNSATVVHTQTAMNYDHDLDPIETRSCNDTNRKNPCLIPTGEEQIAADNGLNLDHINLWWFNRIDENRGAGNSSGNGTCSDGGGYQPRWNTITRYTLYFFQRTPGGTIQRVNLATYYGQAGDWGRDRAFSSGDDTRQSEYLWTDMRWISPGAEPSYDEPIGLGGMQQIYTYCDTSAINGGCTPDTSGPGQGFEVDISDDLVNIVRDESSGARYIYMEVETVSGASENGYEVWAGPRDYIHTVPSEVNARNVKIVNDPSSHYSSGVTVFGLGHLPMNSNYGNRVEVPLIYVGPEYSGTSLYITNYDSDSGANGPLIFYFDSIAQADWSKSFSGSGPDADGRSGRCRIGNCNGQFVDPPYQIRVPTYADECDPNNPDEDICTPFYGGRLMVSYDGGSNDTNHWNISLSGLPYLIR